MWTADNSHELLFVAHHIFSQFVPLKFLAILIRNTTLNRTCASMFLTRAQGLTAEKGNLQQQQCIFANHSALFLQVVKWYRQWAAQRFPRTS